MDGKMGMSTNVIEYPVWPACGEATQVAGT